MMYDGVSGSLVLFGGQSYAGLTFGQPPPRIVTYGDTWVYAQDQWSNFSPALGAAPAPELGGSMVYDAADRYGILIGTNPTTVVPSMAGAVNTTWIWNGAVA